MMTSISDRCDKRKRSEEEYAKWLTGMVMFLKVVLGGSSYTAFLNPVLPPPVYYHCWPLKVRSLVLEGHGEYLLRVFISIKRLYWLSSHTAGEVQFVWLIAFTEKPKLSSDFLLNMRFADANTNNALLDIAPATISE
jgi:hypothetical protein